MVTYCDICLVEEDTKAQANTYCKCCGRDICEKHINQTDGNKYCQDCGTEGENNCTKCELPWSMCSCKKDKSWSIHEDMYSYKNKKTPIWEIL